MPGKRRPHPRPLRRALRIDRMNRPSRICAFSFTTALGCMTAASGQRDALDAARVEWFRRGAPTQDSCKPQVRALSSYAFEVSCGTTVTYVRCTYTSGGTCCETRSSCVEMIAELGGGNPPPLA